MPSASTSSNTRCPKPTSPRSSSSRPCRASRAGSAAILPTGRERACRPMWPFRVHERRNYEHAIDGIVRMMREEGQVELVWRAIAKWEQSGGSHGESAGGGAMTLHRGRRSSTSSRRAEVRFPAQLASSYPAAIIFDRCFQGEGRPFVDTTRDFRGGGEHVSEGGRGGCLRCGLRSLISARRSTSLS